MEEDGWWVGVCCVIRARMYMRFLLQDSDCGMWEENGGPCLNRAFGLAKVTSFGGKPPLPPSCRGGCRTGGALQDVSKTTL